MRFVQPCVPPFCRGQVTERDVIELNLQVCIKTWEEMPVCVAVGCSNRSPRDTERGITFHRVPAGNESLKKEWLVKVKRVNLPKLSCCFVCSDHFEPNCFQVDYQHEFLGGSSRRRRLKETAVPTIFCHKKTEQKRQKQHWHHSAFPRRFSCAKSLSCPDACDSRSRSGS